MAGRIAVVDADNRFVRWESRRVVHEQRLVHRSIHVLVFDSAGRLLVQRRHRTKQTYPGYWDTSCAGHVEESDYLGGPDDRLDEVYAEVAARELHEELGVRAPLIALGRFAPEPGVHYEQIALYRAVSDGPYVLQHDEVEDCRMLAPVELVDFLASNEPITPVLRYWLRTAA